MHECITETTRHFTPAASLAALGVKLHHMKVFECIEQRVHIAQKTVKYRPIDKLYDGFIALLAGAHGLVEINTRLRSDPALQAAFGRTACAEPSVVQQTLDRCRPEHVQQMEQAHDDLFRHHSQAAHHDYQTDWQVLDVDMSGWLCGKKAAFAWHRDILPIHGATDEAVNWDGCWLRAIRRSWLIASLPAMVSSIRLCKPWWKRRKRLCN